MCVLLVIIAVLPLSEKRFFNRHYFGRISLSDREVIVTSFEMGISSRRSF